MRGTTSIAFRLGSGPKMLLLAPATSVAHRFAAERRCAAFRSWQLTGSPQENRRGRGCPDRKQLRAGSLPSRVSLEKPARDPFECIGSALARTAFLPQVNSRKPVQSLLEFQGKCNLIVRIVAHVLKPGPERRRGL